MVSMFDEQIETHKGKTMTDSTEIDVLGTTAQGKLKSFIERIERLLEDKKSVQEDIKEVYNELKGEGFDAKITRKIIKLRGLSKAAREEEEALIELYLTAIGDAA